MTIPGLMAHQSAASFRHPQADTETRMPEVIADPSQMIPIFVSRAQLAPHYDFARHFYSAVTEPTDGEIETDLSLPGVEIGSDADIFDWRSSSVVESLRALNNFFSQASGAALSTVSLEEEIPRLDLYTAQPRPFPRPSWQAELRSAHTREGIIAVLRLFGLNAVADRLGYLRSLTRDDPEEPAIAIESLRAMALFLMGERHLPDPQIGVTPDGYAQIEWRVPHDGILAMVFLSSELIRFAAVSGPLLGKVQRPSVHGTLPKEDVLAAVRHFTSRL